MHFGIRTVRFYIMFDYFAAILVLSRAAIAMISPLFVEEGGLFDHEHQRVAAFAEVSTPQQLEQLHILEEQADNVVVDLLDWQVLIAFLFTKLFAFVP